MYTITYVFEKSFFFSRLVILEGYVILAQVQSEQNSSANFCALCLRFLSCQRSHPPPQEEIFFELCHANQFLRTATCATFYLASSPFPFDLSTIRGSERNRYARNLHIVGKKIHSKQMDTFERIRNVRSNFFFSKDKYKLFHNIFLNSIYVNLY